MPSSKRQKTGSKKDARENRAAEIANTFEWLITAFILAFLFRAFIMEAFRIPTGSMACTLKGAHFRLRCSQCGYRYDYGLGNYGLPQDTIPRGPLKSVYSRCPSCGHYQATGGTTPIAYGDRILVLKCIYQFFEPKRWDVVVFKNPLDPTINYIKRLVGRPGETVEIIDGDIYINGRISRKPPKIQNELWMPVYDNDYQPVQPGEPLTPLGFNGHHAWKQPFKNETGSEWKIDNKNPTLFKLDSAAEQINTMVYDASIGNNFRATYAYDDVKEYKRMPYCSDLMVHFYMNPHDLQGVIGIEMSKYETRYKAWVDSSGEMVIEAVKDNETIELERKTIELPGVNKPILVKFANVDHRLIFEFGSEKLPHNLRDGPDGAGERKTNIEPQVKISGSGKVTLSHMAIFRDIHYTKFQHGDSGGLARAAEGNPFKLGQDEFFVLGDNSPNSADGRWWNRPGVGNNGQEYRVGIVPRDYLVGKALFVYWPSGFKPFAKFPFAIIPNVGGMRFIYGGSNKNL
jgi:signal peptidase I